jgi:alginate O-acetyltransferase complex protein AlgI
MTLTSILILITAVVLLRLVGRGRWRGPLLLASSVLAVYALQSSLPIRGLDYWLPTLTLALAVLCWALTCPKETRSWRKNAPAATILIGLPLLVGLTRYFLPEGLLTPTRPPQTVWVAAVLAGLTLLIWAAARFTQPNRAWTWAGIVLLLAIFFVIKTPAFDLAASAFLRGLVGQSPELASATDLRWLGFSYLAFRLIHTLRDRQSGRLPAVSLQEYVTYAVFFPAFSAGPIDKLDRFVRDLRKDALPLTLANYFNEDLLAGGQRLALGLFKKFALADSLALVALNSQNAAQIHGAGWTWLVVYAYALQIYFDFSGYTDIAIGLGRWLGISLPENFNNPYLKSNLTLFWNNWHMSLTQWFRAYFFNPLTRALRSGKRTLPAWLMVLVTQLATMTLIGLWHGVTLNFVLWGAWHGLGLFIQNRWSDWLKPRRAAWNLSAGWAKALEISGTLLTFHYVALGWVFFALPSVALSGRIFANLFGF